MDKFEKLLKFGHEQHTMKYEGKDYIDLEFIYEQYKQHKKRRRR